MSALASYRSSSLEEVKKLVENGPKVLEDLSSSMASNFKYAGVSEAEAAFLAALSGGDVEKANDTVDACYTATRDALSTGAQSIRTLERFIGLHVPQMEDGNNFGVTVQMMMSKFLKEEREKLEKSLAESSKYYSSRADAIDKFSHLAKTTKSETKSSSKSSATGGKDGDESKESSSASTEEKTTHGDAEMNLHRARALAALDAQAYVDLSVAMQTMMDGYLCILDNLEKNWEKLENPRGKNYGGYGSGGSSMVY